MGVSELFTAPQPHREAILTTSDVRLQIWLLGFTVLPPAVVAWLREQGLNWEP
jgi:hypothetical protein